MSLPIKKKKNSCVFHNFPSVPKGFGNHLMRFLGQSDQIQDVKPFTTAQYYTSKPLSLYAAAPRTTHINGYHETKVTWCSDNWGNSQCSKKCAVEYSKGKSLTKRYGNDKRENTVWEMWTWSQNDEAFTKLLFYIVLFLRIAAKAETSPF